MATMTTTQLKRERLPNRRLSETFDLLAVCSRAEMPAPANDIGDFAASPSGETRHER
jgi:hypothetical protein